MKDNTINRYEKNRAYYLEYKTLQFYEFTPRHTQNYLKLTVVNIPN